MLSKIPRYYSKESLPNTFCHEAASLLLVLLKENVPCEIVSTVGKKSTTGVWNKMRHLGQNTSGKHKFFCVQDTVREAPCSKKKVWVSFSSQLFVPNPRSGIQYLEHVLYPCTVQDTAVGCGYIALGEIQSTGCLAGPADDEFSCLQSDSQPSFAVPSLLDCARSTRYQVLVL